MSSVPVSRSLRSSLASSSPPSGSQSPSSHDSDPENANEVDNDADRSLDGHTSENDSPVRATRSSPNYSKSDASGSGSGSGSASSSGSGSSSESSPQKDDSNQRIRRSTRLSSRRPDEFDADDGGGAEVRMDDEEDEESEEIEEIEEEIDESGEEQEQEGEGEEIEEEEEDGDGLDDEEDGEAGTAPKRPSAYRRKVKEITAGYRIKRRKTTQQSAYQRVSRVGPQYQIEVPAWQPWRSDSVASVPPPPSAGQTYPPPSPSPEEWDGELVFRGSSIINHTEFDDFLRQSETLFCYSNREYNEEMVLELVHTCQYDLKSSIAALNELFEAEKLQANKASPYSLPALDSDLDSERERDAFIGPFDRSEDFCAVCADGGEVFLCDSVGCSKVYHPACLGLSEVPQGHFECPAHFCSVCKDRVWDLCDSCISCPNAFCKLHLPVQWLNERSRFKPRKSAGPLSRPLAPLFNSKCSTCLKLERYDMNSERRIFLRAIQRALEGREFGPQFDLGKLYSAIQEAGGLEKAMSSDAWRTIYKTFEMGRMKRDSAQQAE